MMFNWGKVFKNGPSKICERQNSKNLKCLKFFKGCLSQISLGPFLNTLPNLYSTRKICKVTPFHLGVAFHKETSHLICKSNNWALYKKQHLAEIG